MRRCLLLLSSLLTQLTFIQANEEDLLVLFPPQFGDIAHIDNETVETIYVSCVSYADGVVHAAAYKDGVVKMAISATTREGKQEVGVQRIFRENQEISKSKEYFLDQDRQNTIIHVHDKYIVATSPNKQIITPRRK